MLTDEQLDKLDKLYKLMGQCYLSLFKVAKRAVDNTSKRIR
ncbi:hypothetical protein [Paraclostridium bifermentans]|nr:hypothetical protein [Paraclostridium bifermentans]